jgi:hypothetical protein
MLGEFIFHSLDLLVLNIFFIFLFIDCHMISMIVVIRGIDIIVPIDERVFHLVRLSDMDGYRRGIPFIPMLC